jgi:hypothetical protein
MDLGDGKYESRALDSDSAVALVKRAISDIQGGDDERRFLLLDDFLCAAWPSREAQSQ